MKARGRANSASGALWTAFCAIAASAAIHAALLAALSNVRVEDGGASAPGPAERRAESFKPGDFVFDDAPPPERFKEILEPPREPDPAVAEEEAPAMPPPDAALDPVAPKMASAPQTILPETDWSVPGDAGQEPAPGSPIDDSPDVRVLAAGLPRLEPADGGASMPAALSAPPDPARPAAPAAAIQTPAASGIFAGMPPPAAEMFAPPETAAFRPAAPAGGRIPAAEAKAKSAALAASIPSGVMAAVDSAVVEKEKNAVRALLAADDCAGLDGAVVFDLESATPAGEPGVRYFRLEMSPGTANPLAPVPKDFVLLVDVSGSMSGAGLASIVDQAGGVLDGVLSPRDRFNVVSFRSRFEYAFPGWRPADGQWLAKAKRTIAGFSAGGETDFFAVIDSVLALPRSPDRPLVALAVTDAEATAGLKESSDILGRFTRLNGGLVSVNVYGVGRKLDKPLVELLADGNRGFREFHSPRDRSHYADRLPEFAMRFKDPLLTDISFAFGASSGAETFPSNPPNLYSGGTVAVLGRCPADAKELVFIVRGLNGGDARSGLFRIPFADSRKGDGADALRKSWAVAKLHSMIEDAAASPSAAKENALSAHARGYGLDFDRRLVKPAAKEPGTHGAPQTTGKAEK